MNKYDDLGLIEEKRLRLRGLQRDHRQYNLFLTCVCIVWVGAMLALGVLIVEIAVQVASGLGLGL
jgi:hypothetical protein